MEENFSMEWNMEENFSMEWKIFGMEWKWNGRKLPVWNMEKLSSIPFHTMPYLSRDESLAPEKVCTVLFGRGKLKITMKRHTAC